MSNRNKALGTNLENRVVEKARAKGLEAKKQPGSGVFRDFPSDAVVENGLVECKVRSAEIDAKGNRYIRLDLDFLAKVKKQAEGAGFDWACVVVNAKASQHPMVLCDLDLFLSLLGKDTVEETGEKKQIS